MSEDTTKPVELVMCVQHKAFDYLREKYKLDATAAVFLLYSTPGCVIMIDRAIAESNPDLLQIVTYMILRAEGKILVYKRGKSGGEHRLHNQYAVGVGGHVNMSDVMRTVISSVETKTIPDSIWHCAVRELHEELILTTANVFRAQPLPVIYDDSSEVSSVHVGVSYVLDLDSMEFAKSKEDCIEDVQWLTLEELQSPEWEQKLESWSNIAVKYLVEASNLQNDVASTNKNSNSTKDKMPVEEEQLPVES